MMIVLRQKKLFYYTHLYSLVKFFQSLCLILIPIIDSLTFCFRINATGEINDCKGFNIYKPILSFLVSLLVWIFIVFEFYVAYSFGVLLLNNLIASDGSFIIMRQIDANVAIGFDGRTITKNANHIDCIPRLIIGFPTEEKMKGK